MRCCTKPLYKEASRGFEPRSLDSESRVLTVTPRGQLTCHHCRSSVYRVVALSACCLMSTLFLITTDSISCFAELRFSKSFVTVGFDRSLFRAGLSGVSHPSSNTSCCMALQLKSSDLCYLVALFMSSPCSDIQAATA